MLAQTKKSHFNLGGFHLQFPFLYFSTSKAHFHVELKEGFGSDEVLPLSEVQEAWLPISTCQMLCFFWHFFPHFDDGWGRLVHFWQTKIETVKQTTVTNISPCGFDLNITATNKSSWNHVGGPPLEASRRRFFICEPVFFQQNEPSTWIDFLRLNKGMMESDRQRWHHQSWHRPAGKSSWSLRRNLVQVCSSWSSWGSLQNQGSKNVLKYGFSKGHFISGGDLRHIETPFHLRHIAMQSSWTSP